MMCAGHSYHYLLVSKAFWYLSLPVHITSSLQEHCANNVAKWLCHVDRVWQGNKVVVGMKLSI